MATRALDASNLDTAPLTSSIRLEELRRYRETLPTAVRPSLRAILVPAILLAVVLPLLGGFWLALLWDDGWQAEDAGDWLMYLFILGVILIGPFLLIGVVVRDVAGRAGRRQFRLARFAAANRLTYSPLSPALEFPGMIFALDDGGLGWDVVRDDSSRGLVIGNYTFVTGSGKNARTHRWGFATVRLGTQLPHIVLDAKGNNSLGASSLPLVLDPEQRLSLEGDFDRHFTLYAPHGYERDALYLFTPDVMERFIDHAGRVDVEIVEDRLYLFSRQDLATLDPDVWRWLFGALEALTAKSAQWERWRDDRLGETRLEPGGNGETQIVRPPRGVAAPGRRLQQIVPWYWVVLGLAAAGLGVWALFDNVFGG
ncbi:hypothetical protein ASD65_03680 [Microbacterium sp. Root61]|uniref:hypothetical protein n=1 Tax=Microbacterium sp. Root61 TaxID=1736570 RepID=UPI0006F6E6DE|nr:hypothetical protein [Microbacterium sp. Root61]KRA23625.1 hypothetical protein ASD65_03680 [Microbacterium sp. Root61]